MINGVNFGSKSGRTTKMQKPNWETVNIGEILRHGGKIIGRKIWGAGLEVKIYEYSVFGYMLEIKLVATERKTKMSFNDFEEALARFKEYKRIIDLLNNEGGLLNSWKELNDARGRLKKATFPKF